MESDVVEEENEVEKALKLFSYFDTWNKETISECCRLSKIKVFPSDEIIFGPDESSVKGTHFVVEGTCKIIEHLQLVPKENPKRRARPVREKRLDSTARADNETKYSSLLFNIGGNINLEESGRKSEKMEDTKNASKCEENHSNTSPQLEHGENDDVEGERVAVEKPTEGSGKFYQFYRRLIPYISARNKSVLLKSDDIDSHFLQIGFVNKGCCLGLGERWQNRFLVSVTEVTCLIIPLQFLLQHNPNNIWRRIKLFLNIYLPSEEKVLSDYFINKKWNEDKRKLISSKNVKCPTKMSDVPKSIRLNDSNMRLH
ncbi:UNVERIFIED_CONTAM: hypothetical protein PYX00_005644 [Menopon gallinae]|uniref:Cyclic nucleotide-binding domain-containing protein n=1 Tax=Menopon gallinae TaxID=328185 RepID=A0AAW2HS62_9NEOP